MRPCFAGQARALETDDLLRSTVELLDYHRKTEKIDKLLRFGVDPVLMLTGPIDATQHMFHRIDNFSASVP